jgi:hypothetical protein
VSLATLSLAACGGEGPQAPGSGAGSKAETVAATPAAAPAALAAQAQPRANEAGALSASQDPANQRGGKRYEGGIERLDSKHDVSKLKVGEGEAHGPGDGHDHAEGDGHDHGAEQTGASLLPGEQARTAGRFELVDGSQQVKDLGKLRQGDVAGFDFTFQSAGKEPLVISGIKPSCGCTKADVALLAADGTRQPYTKGDPIPVGTKFVLESEINTDGRQGPFNAQVSLYGNDMRGAFSVRLTADIEPVLTISPSPTVFFGRITTKDRVEQSVTITTTRAEPFLLSLGQERPQDDVTLEFAAKDPDAEGKSSQWEIKVALGPSTEPGMKSYPIQFLSDLAITNPKYPSPDGAPQFHGFMLNLQAQVLGMVSAEPPFLTFGMVKPGEAIERTLRLECHDDEFKLTADIPVVVEGLQGQALPWGDRFQITVVPLEDGRSADLKVLLTGLPDDVNGSIGGQLRVKVGHPNMEEVAIRFSAVCRPGLPPVAPPVAPGGQQK